MRAAASAAKRLIATVAKQVAILETSGAFARGDLEWANGPEYTPHRQGAKIQNSFTEGGLTNNLHRPRRNPRRGIRGARGSSRVAATQPNGLPDPTLQIEVSQSVDIGSPQLRNQGIRGPAALDSRDNNGGEGGMG